MNRNGIPEWARNMGYEDILSWIQENLWTNWPEAASVPTQPIHGDRDSLPDAPPCDEIYSALCGIAHSQSLNHKADVCDECFFDVGFDDDYLMISTDARRMAHQIVSVFGLA